MHYSGTFLLLSSMTSLDFHKTKCSTQLENPWPRTHVRYYPLPRPRGKRNTKSVSRPRAILKLEPRSQAWSGESLWTVGRNAFRTAVRDTSGILCKRAPFGEAFCRPGSENHCQGQQRHQGPNPEELAHTFKFFASIKTLALSGYNKAGNDHRIRTEDYFSFLFSHPPTPRNC